MYHPDLTSKMSNPQLPPRFSDVPSQKVLDVFLPCHVVTPAALVLAVCIFDSIGSLSL